MPTASAAALAALSTVAEPTVDIARVIAWAQAVDELETAKARELDLRNQLLAACFADLQPGTSTVEIGAGYALQAVMRENHRLDEPKTRDALEKMRLTGEVGALLAERLVRWKPELVVGEFGKLPAAMAKLIKKALTSSKSQASLKLRSPKGVDA